MVTAVCLSNKQSSPTFKYGLEEVQLPHVEPKENETLVKIQAASLNHRDVYIMKDQFMGVTAGGIVWSDAVGTIVQSGKPTGASAFQPGDRVIINPGRGWEEDPFGPEKPFSMLGLNPNTGVAAEEVVTETVELFKCPEHLSNYEAAALPLAGLTAYRAVFSKCGVQKGDYVLITGIGGGVALFALQFAIAVGANVYVTSSDPQKIQKAIELGAKGGVNYRDENCIQQLKEQLGGNLFKAIIDGAAGPMYGQYPAVMRQGGIIANYGQTSGIPINFSMYQVGQNLEVRGSTMGSRREFKEMVAFVDQYKIKPIVSSVLKGLSAKTVQDAVDEMEASSQFGKIVIDISN